MEHEKGVFDNQLVNIFKNSLARDGSIHHSTFKTYFSIFNFQLSYEKRLYKNTFNDFLQSFFNE